MKNHDARVGSYETVGAYLREKRMSRDISIEEVSASTGISTAVLQALENEDWEQLPAEVYIKAFYKKYAAYLGLDSAEIQAKYRKQPEKQEQVKDRWGFSTVATLKGQRGNLFAETLRRLFLPVAIVVLGVLLYLFYKNYLAPDNSLGFLYQQHLPTLTSFLTANVSDFIC